MRDGHRSSGIVSPAAGHDRGEWATCGRTDRQAAVTEKYLGQGPGCRAKSMIRDLYPGSTRAARSERTSCLCDSADDIILLTRQVGCLVDADNDSDVYMSSEDEVARDYPPSPVFDCFASELLLPHAIRSNHRLQEMFTYRRRRFRFLRQRKCHHCGPVRRAFG